PATASEYPRKNSVPEGKPPLRRHLSSPPYRFLQYRPHPQHPYLFSALSSLQIRSPENPVHLPLHLLFLRYHFRQDSPLRHFPDLPLPEMFPHRPAVPLPYSPLQSAGHSHPGLFFRPTGRSPADRHLSRLRQELPEGLYLRHIL